MARSVSTPRDTIHTCYAALDDVGNDDFAWHCEDFQNAMLKAFPSMSECNEWIGRENRALLENTFAYIGVSEYCGLVAMWVCKKDLGWGNERLAGLQDQWANRIERTFERYARGCFGQELTLLGSFSNGEAFFAPVNGKQAGEMGLGYSSKECWI